MKDILIRLISAHPTTNPMADKKEVSHLILDRLRMRHFNDKIIFYLCIDAYKLEFFDLHSLKRPRASTYVIQIGRIRKQRDRDAKKAAQGANKLRMKQLRTMAKEGELPLQY